MQQTQRNNAKNSRKEDGNILSVGKLGFRERRICETLN